MRPQVRVVEAALVGVERVVQRPERALARGRLGGVGERDRARVLGLQREVAEARRGRRRRAAARAATRAARAGEVGVDDDERRAGVAADVVVVAQRAGPGALRRGRVIRRQP